MIFITNSSKSSSFLANFHFFIVFSSQVNRYPRWKMLPSFIFSLGSIIFLFLLVFMHFFLIWKLDTSSFLMITLFLLLSHFNPLHRSIYHLTFTSAKSGPNVIWRTGHFVLFASFSLSSFKTSFWSLVSLRANHTQLLHYVFVDRLKVGFWDFIYPEDFIYPLTSEKTPESSDKVQSLDWIFDAPTLLALFSVLRFRCNQIDCESCIFNRRRFFRFSSTYFPNQISATLLRIEYITLSLVERHPIYAILTLFLPTKVVLSAFFLFL